jgi:hypothetical protein
VWGNLQLVMTAVRMRSQALLGLGHNCLCRSESDRSCFIQRLYVCIVWKALAVCACWPAAGVESAEALNNFEGGWLLVGCKFQH